MSKIKRIILLSLFLFIPIFNACSSSPKLVTSKDPSFTEEENAYCMVDIRGEVMYPGIYKIKIGSLINDAIELAGGITKLANIDNINLVAIITGNMKINIPSNIIVSQTDDKININTCSAQELTKIPKIGLVKAQAIIEYRDNNGLFTSIEDIKKVKGIGDSLFEEIKIYITV